MRLPGPLVRGTLLGREKRFLAHVRLEDGRQVVAHCANPGAMRSCLPLGGLCLLSQRPPAAGGLGWSLQLVWADGVPVLVNTAIPNKIVGEALAAGALPELGPGPWRPEQALPEGGRADFAAPGPPRRWLEVKAVSWALGEGWGAWPDAVSVRATGHLAHLRARVRAGEAATLLFVATREDVVRVRAAAELDPAFAAALQAARAAGVRVLGRGVRVDPAAGELTLGGPVEIA